MLSYNPISPMNGEKPSTVATTILGLDSTPANMTLTPDLSKMPKTNGKPAPRHQHIWVVSGPAGAGKTTTAEFIAKTLNLPYVEGDNYHSPSNVDKMATGQALTDEDRWGWLTVLREESVRRLAGGLDGVVVTCSALKRKYRDVIRVAPYYSPNVVIHFIYLHAPESVLLSRVGQRKGHYMGANMVRSQVAVLEPPAAEETDVISVDVSGSPAEIQRDIMEKISETLADAA